MQCPASCPWQVLLRESFPWRPWSETQGWCYSFYSNNFKRNGLCFQFLHFWVAVITLMCSTDPLNFMLPLPAPSFLSPWVYSPLSSVYCLGISWPKQTEFSFLIRIDSLVSCTMLLCYESTWKILSMANFSSICKMLVHDIECHSARHLKHWMSISLNKWNNNFRWAKKKTLENSSWN